MNFINATDYNFENPGQKNIKIGMKFVELVENRINKGLGLSKENIDRICIWLDVMGDNEALVKFNNIISNQISYIDEAVKTI